MFRIKLPNGVEMVFTSAEDFQAAVANGVVTPDSEIFHQKAERWVPIASHPTYHRALSAARAAGQPSAPAQAPTAIAAAPVRRVVPVTPATLTAARPVAATTAQTGPRPTVAPPISQSAQRTRVAAASGGHPAPAVPPLSTSAQRPAISIPTAAPAQPPAPVRPVLRAAPPRAQVAPPTPPPAPIPAPRASELKFVDAEVASSEPSHPVAPLHASAPRPIVHSAPMPAVVIEKPAQPETLADLTEGFDILDTFDAGSATTVELPARAPVHHAEPLHQIPSNPTPPASARSSRPGAAVHDSGAPHHHEPHHHEAHHTPSAAPVPRSGSGKWLIAAGLGAALIGGGALVAWRSGNAKPPVTVAQTQVPAPNATTSAYTQSPKPESTPAPPAPTAPTTIAPASTPPSSQKPAPVETKPAGQAAPHSMAPATTPVTNVDSAPILPGRPQSMSVDLDVSAADVGTSVGGGAAAIAGPSLGVVADHYSDAATDAGKQLEARLGGIGFSRLIAPLRFGSVESMEGARHTMSSAVGMVAAYRSRMQALEKIYGDSAAVAQRGQKASPKEMLLWDHRLPQRETPEAAQAVDLALSKVDQLYAALLAHPEQVKVDATSVTIADPEMARQYQALKQWLGQRFDVWSGSPAEAVPPTVRQVMKAFSDALTH